jgi:hypothetical protein
MKGGELCGIRDDANAGDESIPIEIDAEQQPRRTAPAWRFELEQRRRKSVDPADATSVRPDSGAANRAKNRATGPTPTTGFMAAANSPPPSLIALTSAASIRSMPLTSPSRRSCTNRCSTVFIRARVLAVGIARRRPYASIARRAR